PAVEILILTVFEDDEKVFDALTAGASGYLLKKTNPEKLIDAIRDIHLGGVAMSPGIARKVLGYFAQKQQRAMQLEKLSAREQEILQELANGNSQKMIAHELGISLETVKTHIKRIYEKLQVHSLAEAVAKVFLNK
ncbi:MAG: response regulator transcription factor, partial [Saprospiraceae bacterium]|nr:response regulator transcription factor [Saprospiraceae bacterium]